MIGSLFKNPKAALAYAAFVILGVVLFVGTEGSPGSLQQTVDQFSDGKTAQDRAAERKFGDAANAALAESRQTVGGRKRPQKKAEEEEESPIGFATDDDLVDGAMGFDPSPESVFDGFDPSPSGDPGDERPRLSDQDKRDAEKQFGGWSVEPEGEDE